jgi:hypothetical protein
MLSVRVLATFLSLSRRLAVAPVARRALRDLKSIYDDRLFTKPFGFALGRTPRGVTMYEGSLKIG